MKHRYLAVPLAILLFLLICMLTGCSRPADQEAGDRVTIGAVLPLTGSNAATGNNLKAAMEVAVEFINGSYDLDWDIAQNAGISSLGGAQLEILWADCQSDATTASTAAASLLERGVSGVVGAYSSSYSVAVAAQALEYGVPMVCGSSSSASLTDGVTYDFSAIFNRIAASDEMETIQYFTYLTYLNEQYDAGIQTVAIAYVNNAYGIHANEVFARWAQAYGFTVVAQVSYGTDISTADIEAAQIIAANPDVVFQASYIGDLALFASAYETYGFDPAMVLCYCGGFQDFSFSSIATELGVSYYAGGQACTTVLADQMEVYSAINEAYKAKTGYDIDGPALEEFASVVVLVQAIEACGSTDPADIMEALRGGKFAAPYLTEGYIAFDETGQNVAMASFITQLIGGSYEVVYPLTEYTTAQPVLGGRKGVA